MSRQRTHFAVKFPYTTRIACTRYRYEAVPMTRDKHAVDCKACLKSPDMYWQTTYLDVCGECGETRGGNRSHFDAPGSFRAHRFVLAKEYNPAVEEAALSASPSPENRNG